jgi:predicted transcriptional regulator YdeE
VTFHTPVHSHININRRNDMSTVSSPTTRVEPKIVSRGAFRVAGLRYAGKNQHGEIPAMWDVFLPRTHELPDVPEKANVYYGTDREIPGVPASEGFEYLACVEVPSFDALLQGMVGWEVPAATYAVLPANDVPDIGPTCDYFYGQWINQSAEYALGEGIMFEEYPPEYSTDLIIYLYFPVRHK